MYSLQCTWWSWWNRTHGKHKSGWNQNSPCLWQSVKDTWAHQVTSWWWAGKVTGTGERKWLRVHDESEWSLTTSLMFRFWVPNDEPVGRSLRRTFPFQYAWWDHLLFQSTKCKWSHVSWWQLWLFSLMPRAFRRIENAPCLLTFQNRWARGVWEIHRRQPSCWGWIRITTTVWGPVVQAMHNQERLHQ